MFLITIYNYYNINAANYKLFFFYYIPYTYSILNYWLWKDKIFKKKELLFFVFFCFGFRCQLLVQKLTLCVRWRCYCYPTIVGLGYQLMQLTASGNPSQQDKCYYYIPFVHSHYSDFDFCFFSKFLKKLLFFLTFFLIF